MQIRAASEADLAAIRALFMRGRWVYRTLGDEDLPGLLGSSWAWVGEEQQRIWGLVGIEREERSSTLPATTPMRAQLRALALAFGYPPAEAGVNLLQIATKALEQSGQSALLVVYGPPPWLATELPQAGFLVADEIQFFRLDRIPPLPPSSHSAVELRPLHPDEIEVVAQLDAAAFVILWHYGPKDLWELMFTSRMQVAVLDGAIVGYTALSLYSGSAHLTRIAVDPQLQGQGIGRLLLEDVLAAVAQQHISTISLNTQVSNQRSQRLYRHFGFYPTPQVTQVFTRFIEATS
jgi:ribosomal-protein-alanine N-acetyltransferase